jgi:hypothetical protein
MISVNISAAKLQRLTSRRVSLEIDVDQGGPSGDGST